MAEDRANIGDFTASGRWEGYWQTAISNVGAGRLTIRGYRAEDIIGSLSYAETLYVTVLGRIPSPAQARVLDAVLCAAPDHGLISVHGSTARFVASAQPHSATPAIAASLLCAGDVTISPQATATIIEDGLRRTEQEGSSIEQVAADVVRERLAARERIPGIGHPNHKDEDPRAVALRRVVEAEGQLGPGAAFYDAVHAAWVKERGMHRPINVDGVIAASLHDLGFDARQMTGIAMLAILPGIIAHVFEEQTEGIPMRVIPDAVYTGPAEQELVGGHWAGGPAAR